MAILIYIVIAAVCSVTVVYIYNLRQDIDHRKQEIEQYQRILVLTDEFVDAVNQAQDETGLYITSKNYTHLELYRQKIETVGLLADSLNTTATNDSILEKIVALLLQKEVVVTELNKMFDMQLPVDSEVVQNNTPIMLKDTFLITTTMKDSIVYLNQKKGFRRWITSVFSSERKKDSVVITVMKTDTVKLFESKSEVPDSRVMANVGKNYADQLSTIELQVNRLIVIEQEISSQVADLLLQFSLRVVNSALAETAKSSQLINKSYTVSIVLGGISLTLILFFILLIVNNVNKGKTARKALEEANERTWQIMESRHQLLLSVSHDIKTPLSSILGYLEIWQDEEAIPKDPLRSMQNSGKHILSLLGNLFEFSSLELGMLSTARYNFNLWRQCCEIAEMFEPLAIQKNLIFDVGFDMDKEMEVHSDALKIKQIVINLLSNSVKYTSAGSITFRAEYAGGMIRFVVSDTGAGIPASQMDTLFKPFVRVERNQALAPGNGLGLYVVKGLVDMLRGAITINSTVGEGTRIELTIPATAVASKVAEMEGVKKILLMDDDASFLMMFAEMLVRFGHTVVQCDHPDTFEQPFDEYDVVMTDMEMGNISGTDVLKKIRNSGATPDVILISGRSDYHWTKAIEDGFDGYLPKPVTMQTLESVIRKVSVTPTRGERTPESEFGLLEDMFDGDRQAISEVLKVFVKSAAGNIQALRKAVADHDFEHTQAICHRMLPMFMQVQAPDDCLDFLKRMDAARADHPDQHPDWRKNTSNFTVHAGKFMKRVREFLKIDKKSNTFAMIKKI